MPKRYTTGDSHPAMRNSNKTSLSKEEKATTGIPNCARSLTSGVNDSETLIWDERKRTEFFRKNATRTKHMQITLITNRKKLRTTSIIGPAKILRRLRWGVVFFDFSQIAISNYCKRWRAIHTWNYTCFLVPIDREQQQVCTPNEPDPSTSDNN